MRGSSLAADGFVDDVGDASAALRTRHGVVVPPNMRYRVFLLVGLGIAVQYWIRSSISVAVTVAPRRYEWSGPWAALSLSAFFVGYMPGQVPWSLFATRVSPRVALACSVVICSLGTFAVAGALESGPTVCAFRALTGLAQAATFPCTYALMNEWAETAEISRAIGLVKCIGENGGALLGLAGSELLLRQRLVLPGGVRIGGLQLVFFSPAVAGIIWVAFFLVLVPPRGAYRSSRAPAGAVVADKAPASVPWRGLVGRVPWVCYGNHVAGNWMSYLLLTELPTFARRELGLSGAKASLAVATPYVFIGAGLYYGGRACDAAILRGYKRSNVRVFCQSLSVLGGFFLVAAALVAKTSAALSLVFLNIGAVGVTGVGLGVCAIYLELSREWSGIFYALSNTLATLPGILAPIATASLLNRCGNYTGWIAAFAIGLALGGAATAVFVATFRGEDLSPLPSLDGKRDADPLRAPLLLPGDATTRPAYVDF